jgi:mono/diheme cytochrome c family protein
VPAVSGEVAPARSEVMSGAVAASDQPVFTANLFRQFSSICGGCHVEQGLGMFHVGETTFATDMTTRVLERIQSEQPGQYMPPFPPLGKPFSERQPGDPVLDLLANLQAWFDRGKPPVVYYLPATVDPSASPYLMTKELGSALTNIGSCVPDKAIVATETTRTAELDSFFASATELPDSLADTDLFTLDTETLARSGVIGFAPAYPLWADDAHKLRFLRVPRGEAIEFNKATQEFAIPTNTRVYKTFLKHVIDKNGNDSYRKIETRLIVSRPDKDLPDGTHQNRALFGTYAWNDDETEARLVKDPLRNGEPFRDRLLTYVLDEVKAQALIDSKPANLEYQLKAQGLLRTYAIPGAGRCVDCHMGSPSQSFLLGLTPLQLTRRPVGEGGVTQPTGPDELTQLQRLIDYGVIAGMTSPEDVVKLEDSQGARAPRNDFELGAQAYMIGNCAHCHNPRGLPTVQNPVLAGVLDFLPSEAGGIFQFPLERMSPRIQRGLNQDVPIPYVTPSLRELPIDYLKNPQWIPKYYKILPPGSAPADWYDYDFKVYYNHIDAPWRSLIYRNVDTPFTYADDYAIFPHMPRNTPGYDCRTARIMGDWMVSIPAVIKHPERDQNATFSTNPSLIALMDTEPQPYVEVMPGEAGYARALADAETRLTAYHSGERYSLCLQSDIIDPGVTSTGDPVPQDATVRDPTNPARVIYPADGVPNLPFWAVSDLTNVPGDWYPRRSDWEDVFIGGIFPAPLSTGQKALAALERQKDVVRLLQNVTLTPSLRSLATTEVPFGLWQEKPGCDFSSVPKVADFTPEQRPAWMNSATPPPDAAPVYMESPGAAIFNMICINCHGPNADAKGRLADSIADMTGGTARVANLRDGIFGPPGMPGSARERVFGEVASPPDVTADDWGGRYMAWMALGGTQRILPPSLLNLVGRTPVLGEARTRLEAQGTANMLATAQELCRNVLPYVGDSVGFGLDGAVKSTELSLISKNGDAELWKRLCNLGNDQIVRVVAPQHNWITLGFAGMSIVPALSFFYAAGYPSDAPVLDDHGRVQSSLTPDNLFPWCIEKPPAPDQQAASDALMLAQYGSGTPLPYCPDALFTREASGKATYQLVESQCCVDGTCDQEPAYNQNQCDISRWSARGAINAGFSVFLYLDQIARGATPKLQYNECERLGQ